MFYGDAQNHNTRQLPFRLRRAQRQLRLKIRAVIVVVIRDNVNAAGDLSSPLTNAVYADARNFARVPTIPKMIDSLVVRQKFSIVFRGRAVVN